MAPRGSGARRLGLFAREGARVAVAFHSRAAAAGETVDGIQSAGGEALLVQADVAASVQVQHAVDVTLQAFGRIDTLISSAGPLLLH